MITGRPGGQRLGASQLTVPLSPSFMMLAGPDPPAGRELQVEPCSGPGLPVRHRFCQVGTAGATAAASPQAAAPLQLPRAAAAAGPARVRRAPGRRIERRPLGRLSLRRRLTASDSSESESGSKAQRLGEEAARVCRKDTVPVPVVRRYYCLLVQLRS